MMTEEKWSLSPAGSQMSLNCEHCAKEMAVTISLEELSEIDVPSVNDYCPDCSEPFSVEMDAETQARLMRLAVDRRYAASPGWLITGRAPVLKSEPSSSPASFPLCIPPDVVFSLQAVAKFIPDRTALCVLNERVGVEPIRQDDESVPMIEIRAVKRTGKPVITTRFGNCLPWETTDCLRSLGYRYSVDEAVWVATVDNNACATNSKHSSYAHQALQCSPKGHRSFYDPGQPTSRVHSNIAQACVEVQQNKTQRVISYHGMGGGELILRTPHGFLRLVEVFYTWRGEDRAFPTVERFSSLPDDSAVVQTVNEMMNAAGYDSGSDGLFWTTDRNSAVMVRYLQPE